MKGFIFFMLLLCSSLVSSDVDLIFDNLSTRAYSGSGDDIIIGGFVVSGSPSTHEGMHLIVEALGPTLAENDPNLKDVLLNPSMIIYDENGSVFAQNDDWRTDEEAQSLIDHNVAPKYSNESSVLRKFPPGSYTVHVTGQNGQTGIGMINLNDTQGTIRCATCEVSSVTGSLSSFSGAYLAVVPLSPSKLINISSRIYVGTDDKVAIPGLIVKDNGQTTCDRKYYFRGLGPSLNGKVAFALDDPKLTLYRYNSSTLIWDIITSNNDWRNSANILDIEKYLEVPSHTNEAVIFIDLEEGVYSAILEGVNGTGVGLVEVFEIDLCP